MNSFTPYTILRAAVIQVLDDDPNPTPAEQGLLTVLKDQIILEGCLELLRDAMASVN